MHKSERGGTWQASGGPTQQGFGRTNGCPDPEIVPSTADQEIGFEEVGPPYNFMDPGPLEGPLREVAATISPCHVAQKLPKIAQKRSKYQRTSLFVFRFTSLHQNIRFSI